MALSPMYCSWIPNEASEADEAAEGTKTTVLLYDDWNQYCGATTRLATSVRANQVVVYSMALVWWVLYGVEQADSQTRL